MTAQVELLEHHSEIARQEDKRARFHSTRAICWCEHNGREHSKRGPCKVDGCSCQGFNFNGWLRKRKATK